MERFVAGDIIVVSFPFTDLSAMRRRPALVMSSIQGEDIIICEITSKIRIDPYVVLLENQDLMFGRLKVNSIIRTNRILTIHRNKIIYKFDKISDSKLKEVLDKIKSIFNIL